METLKNLASIDITWRAPWFVPKPFPYQCGQLLFMPLLDLWGTVGYAPLLVRRQYGSQQFIPMTVGLASTDSDYSEEGYRSLFQSIALYWRIRYESGINAYTDQTILGYDAWKHIRGCNLIIPSTDESNP